VLNPNCPAGHKSNSYFSVCLPNWANSFRLKESKLTVDGTHIKEGTLSVELICRMVPVVVICRKVPVELICRTVPVELICKTVLVELM